VALSPPRTRTCPRFGIGVVSSAMRSVTSVAEADSSSTNPFGRQILSSATVRVGRRRRWGCAGHRFGAALNRGQSLSILALVLFGIPLGAGASGSIAGANRRHWIMTNGRLGTATCATAVR